MKKQELAVKKVIGIWVRTTNHEEQALTDIQALWGRFMSEGVMSKIPNLIGSEVYSIYTEYEGDFTKPYTTVLACEVSSLDEIPEGMKGLEIGGGDYVKFLAKGNLNEGAVGNAWMEIWKSGVNRRYTTDFEVYGAKSQNREDAEVDIFVAVK